MTQIIIDAKKVLTKMITDELSSATASFTPVLLMLGFSKVSFLPLQIGDPFVTLAQRLPFTYYGFTKPKFKINSAGFVGREVNMSLPLEGFISRIGRESTKFLQRLYLVIKNSQTEFHD